MRIFPSFISQRERHWIISIVVVAVICSSLPYVYSALHAGSRSTYLWTNPFGSADTNVYFSWMKQAKLGHVFFENLYTNEPQHGSLFQPLWLVLGWIAGLSNMAIPIVFHIARAVLAVVFLLFLYRLLIRPLFWEERQRILAMLLLAFSSGIGTFFSINIDMTRNGQQQLLLVPTDQWVPESNTLLTLLHSPLFILSQLLLVGIFWNFVFLNKRNAHFFIALLALLSFLHPYDLVTAAVLLPAFLVIRMIRENELTRAQVLLTLRTLIIAGLAALSPVLAFIVAGTREPAIGIWTQQNVTRSPFPHSYILGYGLLVPFAVIGWMLWRKTQNTLQLFILTWAVTSILLLYIPVQINRRFSNGLHMPFVILATAGIDYCWMWIRERLRRRKWQRRIMLAAFGWLVGLGIFFSSAVTIIRTISWWENAGDSVNHISKNEAQAMQWLEKGTPADAVVFAHPFIGNLIPAMTGRRVFIGHSQLTLRWKEKLQQSVDWFWKNNTNDPAKHEFLLKYGITHVYFGPHEDHLGNFDPSRKAYLAPVHRDGEVTVYRVLP